MHKSQLLTLAFIFSLFLSCSNSQNKEALELDSNWTFRQVGEQEWLKAKIPGSVQSNLLSLNKIPDPFVGTNEKEIQWIENKDWEFKAEFKIDKVKLAKDHLELKFNGLDTYAEVFLNGSKILESDNMFQNHTVDIKAIAKENNILIVKLYSPIQKTLAKFQTLPYQLPASNDVGKDKVSPHVRKAQSHFGWDWGPRIVTIGIWKTIEFISYDINKITNLEIIQKNHRQKRKEFEGFVDLEFKLETQFETKNKDLLKITVSDDSLSLTKSFQANEIKKITLIDPKFWWTHNLGEAHLYNVNVELIRDEKVIDSYHQKLGIRTIELIQNKDVVGTSFYFKLNGKPVYMKGANTIPQDALLSRVTQEKVIQLFDDAIESNMNMLRVWGGGIYQSDHFYNLADEYGILIWQDFMFACSMYPGDSDFMKSVKIEVEQQIKRLRHHASLALWCGNNEVDVAWHNWGWQDQHKLTAEDQKTIWSDYKKLFQEMIPNAVDSLNRSIPYITTSPLSNWGTPENFNHHNMHYWGVWHGEDNFEEFKNNVPRFMAEYGFQSFPEISTIKKFADSTQFDLKSDVLKWHQKSYKGNRLLLAHLEQYYESPKDFADFIYKNQLTQALAIEMAIDAHRMNRPKNMGTLYWQMNDNWPGPTWSGIDYYGKWKAMQYAVKNAYAANRIIFDEDESFIYIYSINEDSKNVSQNLYNLYLINEGTQGIELINEPVFYNQATRISKFKIKKKTIEKMKGFDKNKSVLLAESATAPDYSSSAFKQNSKMLSSRIFHFVKAKDFKAKFYFKVSIKQTDNQTTINFSPSLSVQEIDNHQAIYLKLKYDENAKFSDNYFDLIPMQYKSITVDRKIRKEDLIIRTLRKK